MFRSKTILTTLISTSILGSVIALPAKANQSNLTRSGNAESTLSQIDYVNSRYDNQSNDDFKNIVGLTGLVVGAGVIGYQISKAYKPSWAGSLPGINNSNATLLARVSPKLRQELLRLVHNQQTVDRLLNGTSISHPQRSANWVAEKVIYDLKRDR